MLKITVNLLPPSLTLKYADMLTPLLTPRKPCWYVALQTQTRVNHRYRSDMRKLRSLEWHKNNTIVKPTAFFPLFSRRGDFLCFCRIIKNILIPHFLSCSPKETQPCLQISFPHILHHDFMPYLSLRVM